MALKPGDRVRITRTVPVEARHGLTEGVVNIVQALDERGSVWVCGDGDERVLLHGHEFMPAEERGDVGVPG